MWPSITNWPANASARASASSGVAASASLASNKRAEHLVERDERRRHAGGGLEEAPARQTLAAGEPVAHRRSAAPPPRAACAVCGTGRYSSLETICVGTGEANDDGLRRQQSADHLIAQEFHGAPPGSTSVTVPFHQYQATKCHKTPVLLANARSPPVIARTASLLTRKKWKVCSDLRRSKIILSSRAGQPTGRWQLAMTAEALTNP